MRLMMSIYNKVYDVCVQQGLEWGSIKEICDAVKVIAIRRTIVIECAMWCDKS